MHSQRLTRFPFFQHFWKTSSLLFLVLLPLFYVGCSSKEVNKDDPDALFADAEEAFKDEKYLIAIEKYRDIKNRFPYSSRAVDSELRIADTQYEQGNYIESESAYEIFKELHPTHPKSDYVQFRIAMSYFKQIPDNTSRDLSAAYKAIDSFVLLVDKFPNSEYAPKAKELGLECRKKIAEHENYVADFYYQRKHYLSASYRYAALLKDYSGFGFDEEALYRLGQCYFHIKQMNNAADAFKRLLTQFPSTSYKSEVQSRIEELGKQN